MSESAHISCRHGAGFTLIEVLVSLVIFALAAMVLGASYVNVLNSYAAVSHRGEHEQDLRLARAAVLAEPDRGIAARGGVLSRPAGGSVQWSATIEEGEVADLFRVAWHCEISDPALGAPWVRDEVFFLLRPTWSDPAVRDRLRHQAQQRREKRGTS